MEENKSSKKLFAFNSFTGIVQLALTAILIFICIPVFIKNLGDEAYGIFCIVSVIGNLTIFANLSLDSSLIKFLAEQGKCKESDYDIITMLILMLIVLVPLSILLFVFRDFILTDILDVPIEYLTQSSVLLSYLIISNFLLLLGKVFASILDARHKIYLTNFAMFVYSVIYWAGIIITVLNGKGLEEIGQIILMAAVVWFMIVFSLAFREWGWLEVSGLHRQFKPLAKKQIKYSSKIYFGSILSFAYEPLTKILISNYIGVSYVGIYDIALKIKSQLSAVFIKILQPLFPTIANMKDSTNIKSLIGKFTTYLFFIIIPILAIIIFASKTIISLWIGGDNVAIISLSTIVITSFCLLFSIPSMPIYFYLRAKNHPDKEIYIQAANAIFNVIIIIVSYKYIGFYSILLGNSCAFILSFLFCIYYQKKYLGIIPFSTKGEKTKFLLSLGIIIGSSALFYFLFNEVSFLNLILKIIFVSIVSLLTFFVLKIFKKEDFRFK